MPRMFFEKLWNQLDVSFKSFHVTTKKTNGTNLRIKPCFIWLPVLSAAVLLGWAIWRIYRSMRDFHVAIKVKPLRQELWLVFIKIVWKEKTRTSALLQGRWKKARGTARGTRSQEQPARESSVIKVQEKGFFFMKFAIRDIEEAYVLNSWVLRHCNRAVKQRYRKCYCFH